MMKMLKIIMVSCLCIMPLMLTAGCGNAETNETDIVSSVEDNNEIIFSADDIKSFVFEGEEFTIPVKYEDIIALGWTISEDTYDVYEDVDTLIFLVMENEKYENIPLYLSGKRHGSGSGTVEDLENELITNGVWTLSVDLYSVEGELDFSVYPEFEIKGVGLGSSLEDIQLAFGDDYDELLSYPEDEYYVYSAYEEEGDDTIVYHLMLGLINDELCSIDLYIYYM